MTHIALARGPDQGGDPLLHLAGRLVGEGDGEDLPRLRAAGRQQVGDPVGQHTGLARAGASDDQQRTALVPDGCALLVVEPFEQRAGVGRPARGVGIYGGLRAAKPGRSSKSEVTDRSLGGPADSPRSRPKAPCRSTEAIGTSRAP